MKVHAMLDEYVPFIVLLTALYTVAGGICVRGNLQAVVKAILLDYEARSPDLISQPTYGKLREPLLRVTALARAFPAPPAMNGNYSQTTNQLITITTAVPHRLNNGDTVLLNFTDTSGNAAPTMQRGKSFALYGPAITGRISPTSAGPRSAPGLSAPRRTGRRLPFRRSRPLVQRSQPATSTFIRRMSRRASTAAAVLRSRV